MSRIDDGDRDLELDRLRIVLADNILTDEAGATASAASTRRGWTARSTRSRRTSNSASGRRRATSSTTSSCRRVAGRLIN